VVGCSKQPPEVTLEQQVPAEMRTGEAASPGATEPGAPERETLQFAAVDIAFDEAPQEATAGEVTITLTNKGNIQHNVAFDELGGDVVVEANGGETATGDVELEPGIYTYFCAVPGHRAAGMEGTLTVAAP
jgi:plastocyanin